MKASISTRIPGKGSASHRFRSTSLAGLALLTAGLLATSGCSSGSSASKLEVGPITFTDANGTAQKSLKTLIAGQSTYVDVDLKNDSQLLGADWSVYCGSAPPPGTPLPPGQTQDESCGTFTPAHTMSGPVPGYVVSGSGYVALYTAPATPPKEGTVTLYVSATSDHSRSATVTLTIDGLPISVGFAPAPPSALEVGASTQIRAVLNNDTTNAGVEWTVICGSSECGSFSPTKTTSGVATTYNSPATEVAGGIVKVIATSVADPTKAFSSTISITAASSNVVMGTVQTAQQPVGGALVSLYEAVTSETSTDMAADSSDATRISTEITDEEGAFSIPYGYQCPTPDTQMYLVATGGNAGGGNNPDLALITALGPCLKLGSSRVVINEATTTAAVYALSRFIVDSQHVGSSQTSPAAVAAAFATANDLVDITTGLVRTNTVSGEGIVPQAKINTLANMLSICAQTAGSAQRDGSPCDRLFQATIPKTISATKTNNTVDILLYLARNSINVSDSQSQLAALYRQAASNVALTPVLSNEPNDWTIAIQFPRMPGAQESAVSETPSLENISSFTDAAGNVWVIGNGAIITEFVGGASCAGAPNSLLPLTFNSGNIQ